MVSGSGQHALDGARFDVAIVGGGPAGLSAALLLGRCRRSVALFDDDRPRNARARAAHGFFTRDGVAPAELRRIGREQLTPYGVRVFDATVEDIQRESDGFRLETAGGLRVGARKLLLATGMRDYLPDIPGVAECTGAGVYQCPFCDGWEVRDRVLGAFGSDAACVELAFALKSFSDSVTLFTGGLYSLSHEDRARLERQRIAWRTEPVTRLGSRDGRLSHVRLASGDEVPCDALFVHFGQEQRSPFVERLGCELTPARTVRTYHNERTSVPGVFVAGDASIEMQSIAVAAAEGYKAAVAIHRELREEDQR